MNQQNMQKEQIGLATAVAEARLALKRNKPQEARVAVARAVRSWRKAGPRARALFLEAPGLIAWLHFCDGDIDKARHSCALLLSWGRRMGKPAAVAAALIRRANLKINEGAYDEARLAAERAAVLCDWEISSHSGYAHARLLEGVAHAHLGHFARAKERFQEASEAAKADDPTLYVACLQSLGNACVTLGEHHRARTHYRMALKLAAQQADTLRRFNALLGLAMTDLRCGGSGLEHRGMLKMILTEGARFQQCLAAEYLAGFSALDGKDESSILKLYRRGLNEARKLKSGYFGAELHRALAEFWLDRGNLHYSRLHLRRGEGLACHCEDKLALERIAIDISENPNAQKLHRLLLHAERASRGGYKYEQMLAYGRIAFYAGTLEDHGMVETYRGRMAFLAEECGAGNILNRKDDADAPKPLTRTAPALAEHGILTQCPVLEAQGELIFRVAPTSVPILIRGESGTGKELFANLVHQVGSRREQPFLAVNCAAIPGELMESELFGHRKGSFTGALEEHPGLIRMADKGTLFLDEIGELRPSLQAKLLRVLETGEIRRVGDTHAETLDVRLVAATNINIEAAIESGDFRRDFYYRLCGLELILPPLRERREDIPVLAAHFLKEASERLGKHLKLPFRTLQWLMTLRWRGNTRELKSAMERAAALCLDGEEVSIEHFSAFVKPQATSLSDELAGIERSRIEHALKTTNGNIAAAARLLGLSRTTVNGKIERLGIQR